MPNLVLPAARLAEPKPLLEAPNGAFGALVGFGSTGEVVAVDDPDLGWLRASCGRWFNLRRSDPADEDMAKEGRDVRWRVAQSNNNRLWLVDSAHLGEKNVDGRGGRDATTRSSSDRVT